MPDRNMAQRIEDVTHRAPIPSTLSLASVVLELLEAVIVGYLVELEDAISGLAKHTPKPCLIGRALLDLPDPYQTVLAYLVDTPWSSDGFSDDEVAARMKAAGLKSSASSVRLHRRGYCSCR